MGSVEGGGSRGWAACRRTGVTIPVYMSTCRTPPTTNYMLSATPVRVVGSRMAIPDTRRRPARDRLGRGVVRRRKNAKLATLGGAANPVMIQL